MKHFLAKHLLIFVATGLVTFIAGALSVRGLALILTDTQSQQIASLSARISELEQEDLRVTNEAMKASVSAVNKTFLSYNKLLEKTSDAKLQKIDIVKQEPELLKIIKLLADLQYEEASKSIAAVEKAIDKAIADSQPKPASTSSQTGTKTTAAAPVSQTLPSDGFSKQTVQTDAGNFVVSIIAADLASTKIITDTAGENDCVDVVCPTKSLADYVSANGGFAGVNGSYFCPPDYAQCVGKEGSFGTLVFNARLRKYINSDNNKFSTVPMFVQTADHGMRFMGQTVEWGRDTGIIGGLASYPLLVSGGQVATSDESGNGRNFIGVKGGNVYIGHVHGASFAKTAKVLATLGLEHALNLDAGGSTALYYNGSYKLGPGRLIPNAIILAH